MTKKQQKITFTFPWKGLTVIISRDLGGWVLSSCSPSAVLVSTGGGFHMCLVP